MKRLTKEERTQIVSTVVNSGLIGIKAAEYALQLAHKKTNGE